MAALLPDLDRAGAEPFLRQALSDPDQDVRLTACDLRCSWCDTPYASWNPEGTAKTVAQLMLEIENFPAARHVVLTGGEPMIAKDAAELAAAVKASGRHLTIETAATVDPAGIACDLASLSPKLLNSAPDAADHAGRQIPFDAVGRIRQRGAQESRFELLAMGAVVDPFA